MQDIISSVSKSHLLRCAFLFGLIIIFCSGFLDEGSLSSVSVVHAMPTNTRYFASTSCSSPMAPKSQSLLVVLLDRSGSLTSQPGATDPNLYSTSVTKALADLWPGNMAVIPFSGDTTTLPILGPDTLADLAQRTDLKTKVENYPIGGDTPLGPAVHAALDLLRQKGSPAGSRVILITDGNPTGNGDNDGSHQENDIRKNLISQFCQLAIPISAFGLTIDPHSPDGQDANKLLTDITTGTGASYTNVTGPEDLARAVIQLYAQWLGLTFTQVQSDNSNYPVSIDNFAQKVSIVSFRSDSNHTITLIGPDGRQVTQGVQRSTPPDRHYEIDSLDVSGGITPGTYTVNVGGDPNAQVYALVNSPLQVQLVQPTSQAVAYADKSVSIQAQFVNGNEQVTPGSGEATITAKVTLLVNGQPTGPPTNDVVLTQQKTAQGELGPLFTGGALVYNQPGQLHIELLGTYRGTKRQTSFTFPLLKPLPPPKPKPKPCDAQCQWQKYAPLVIGGLIGLGLLLLLALLAFFYIRWRRDQPRPYGYLTNGRPNGDVELDRFSKPVISSNEIQTKGMFNFGAAHFELVFVKDGTVKIRTARGNASKVSVDFPGKTTPEEVNNTGVELKPGRKIYVDNRKAASFETSRGKRWS